MGLDTCRRQDKSPSGLQDYRPATAVVPFSFVSLIASGRRTGKSARGWRGRFTRNCAFGRMCSPRLESGRVRDRVCCVACTTCVDGGVATRQVLLLRTAACEWVAVACAPCAVAFSATRCM